MYWSIEPPLAERLEFAIATLTALTANINRDAKKRPEPFTAKDFLRRWGETPEPEQDVDGMAPERLMPLMERFVRQQERAQAPNEPVRRQGKGSSSPSG